MSPRPRIGRWLAPALAALALAVSASVPVAPTPVASSAVVVLARATAPAPALADQPPPSRAPVVAAQAAVGGTAAKVVPASPPPAAKPAIVQPQRDSKSTKPKPEPVKAQPPRPVQPKPPKPAPAPSYRGANHVWIPSLGINRSVSGFSCSRTRPPDNYVYRWGCAGSNNIYLMGHAYSVFKPLHDAYVSGRLRTGMRVIYADGGGHVQTYVVSFWRLVSPVGAGWAYAAQSRPSMTLQTCVGARSQWRLIVRLVAG
jgi:hypothetical protein